jgi:hypothetical protein
MAWMRLAIAIGALLIWAEPSRAATLTPVGSDGRSVSWVCSSCGQTGDSRAPNPAFSLFNEVLPAYGGTAIQYSSISSNFIGGVGSAAGDAAGTSYASTMILEFTLDHSAAYQIALGLDYFQSHSRLDDSSVSGSLMRESQGVLTTLMDEAITSATAEIPSGENQKLFNQIGILDPGHYMLQLTAQVRSSGIADDFASTNFDFTLSIPEPGNSALLLLAAAPLLRRLSTRRS